MLSRFVLRVTSVLWLFSAASPALGEEPYRVLVVHAYAQEYPWTRSQHQGFMSTLRAGTNRQLSVSTEHLDTKRLRYDTSYARRFALYLREKYAGYRPELIYVTDDNALTFVRDHLLRLFPDVGVVFSGVNNYDVLSELSNLPIRGVFEKKEISPNLELVKHFGGASAGILFVGDTSSTYQAIEQETRRQLILHPDIDATFISASRIDLLQRQLAGRGEKFLFLTTIGEIRGEEGQTLPLREIIRGIVSSGDFAVISMEDAYLESGVLGGYVTNGQSQGVAAAELALSHQRGLPMALITNHTVSPNTYMFDYTELKRRGLRLPGDIRNQAKILNEPPSPYARHRTLVLTTLILLTGIALMLMIVLLAVRSRKDAQIRGMLNTVSQQAERLRRTTAALTAAQQISEIGIWEWYLDSDAMSWSDGVYQIIDRAPADYPASLENYLRCVVEFDRERVAAALRDVAVCRVAVQFEHGMGDTEVSRKHVRVLGNCRDAGMDGAILTLTMLDVTNLRKNELLEKERVARIERYQSALLNWARFNYENLQEALEQATEISARTMQVSRVSIWLYDDSRTRLECVDMHELDAGHDHGLIFGKSEAPRYFSALQAGRVLAVEDATADLRTAELNECYLKPNGIRSMLNVPLVNEGENFGVVSHEQINELRIWTSHEQEFASAIAQAVMLSLEVDRRRSMERRLEHQAYHDDLTGLPNRALFMDRLEQGIKQAHRDGTLLAVFFLDLDNFKQINDSFGHAIGDRLLIEVAAKLTDTVRDVDTVSRFGGDEFAVLMGGFSVMDQVNELTLKLVDLMREPLIVDDHDLFVTSSIGVSIYPSDALAAETLLRNADAAMYKAKDEGRNGFQFYTKDMTERAFEKVLLISSLRHAVERQEFEVYFQPQADVTTDQIIGLEALLRWHHPDLGMVSPLKFIPAAEESGLIVPLDRWVMHTACSQLRAWRDAGLETGRLSLNLAMQQLAQADLVKFIERTLGETGCEPTWLAFEVTEGQIMKDPDQSIAVLQQISDLGIHIAVDDFGTGYSSLTYLKRLPVDCLKIDRVFVRDVPDDEDDVAIVRSVIALSQSMRLSVIAEGVESQAQVEFLLEEGCSRIQGFFFARPMPAAEVPATLSENMPMRKAE